MSYNVYLKLEAHQDILEATLWYETQRNGLGAEFYQEIEKVKDLLSSNPLMFEVKYKRNVRWILTERFPFIVVYVINGNNVIILAVVNTYRHPRVWKTRA